MMGTESECILCDKLDCAGHVLAEAGPLEARIADLEKQLAEANDALRTMAKVNANALESERQLGEMTKRAETAERLIKDAGFRVALDLLGVMTLWCVSCGRDSGYHWQNCVKVSR